MSFPLSRDQSVGPPDALRLLRVLQGIAPCDNLQAQNINKMKECLKAHLHPFATPLRDCSQIKMYGFCPVLLHQVPVSTLASNLSVTWKWLCNSFAATSQTRRHGWM